MAVHKGGRGPGHLARGPWVYAPATGYALVAPSGTWDGTPGKGVSASWADVTTGVPVDNTRAAYNARTGLTAAAMPVVHWWQPSQIRGVGPTLVGCAADAKGGIAKVTFNVEGTTQDATLTYLVDTDVNGVAHIRPFWGINVDCAAAYAAKGATQGGQPTAIRVYAKAYANDGTMQPRIIGPLIVYPRAVAYDWVKTVKASGGDYTALSAAMQGMKDALAGGAECAQVTIGTSGTYEWGSPDNWGMPWSKGMSCVTTLPGVTATIIRGAAFDPANTGSSNALPNAAWRMYTYANNLEFRGAGIVIDRHNISGIFSENTVNNAYNLHPLDGSQLVTGSFFFNGCVITNSIGTWQQTYWNGTPAPQLQITESNGNAVVAWAYGCTVNYQNGGSAFATFGAFSNVNAGFSTPHVNPRFVFGEYYANAPLANESYYSTARNGMSVTYTGAQATATVAFDGDATLTLVAGGVNAHVFTLLDPNTQPLGDGTTTFTKWSQIVSYINTSLGGAGWSATLIDDSFCAYNMRDATGAFGPTSCKSVAVTLKSAFGIHSEYCHWLSGGLENSLVWDCTVVNSGWSTSFLNLEATGANLRDLSIKNLTFDPGGSGLTTGNGTNPTGHHVCLENLTMAEPMLINRGGTGLFDDYSSVTQCVALSMSLYTGGYGTGSSITPTNSIVGGTPPASSGNFNPMGGTAAIDYTTWSGLFTDNTASAWNFTPKPASALATNLFTSINPRDAQTAARAANDAAGAWKLGGTAPTWPF